MSNHLSFFKRSLVLLASFTAFSQLPFAAENLSSQKDQVDPALAKSFFSDVNLGYPGLESVKKAVEAKDWDTACRDYLEFRRAKSTAKWKVNPASKPAKAVRETDSDGDLILKHILVDRIYHMVPQPLQMGERIDWTFNPVSINDPSYTKEFQWTVLNRHHSWETLGNAYWATLDNKYTREWMAQLEGWIVDCPLNPSWDIGTAEESYSWRLIETGIRMFTTWPNTYYHFVTSPAFTPKANLLYASSCLTQARHLSRFLKEFPGRSGNHVAMECTGLATVGCLFPELREADAFIAVATARMTSEISKQVYPDGAQNELTPGYHTVTMDCFWDLAEVLTLNGRAVPPVFDEKLKAMHRFLVTLADSRGEIPLFNDSWHFNVQNYAKRAFKRWGDPEFQFAATRGAEGTPPPLSEALPYAGFYTMRSSWSPDALYACFRGGPPGTGHWHEGKLHFVLSAFGQPLVIDVGRAVYDESEWRRYVIGTTSRNTVTVDGREQHQGGIIGTPDNVDMKQVCDNPWMTCPQFDYVASTYNSGYQTSEYLRKRYLPIQYTGPVDKSVSHTRHFFFIKPDYVVAVDFLDGTGMHRYDAYFHLDALDATIQESSQSVVTQGNAKANILLHPLDPEGLKVRIATGQEKPLLGWIPNGNDPLRKIPTVVYTKEQTAPASIATLFYPFKGKVVPAVKFQKIVAGSGWARRIKTTEGTVEIAISRNAEKLEVESSLAGRVKTDGRALVIRRQNGDPAVWVGVDKASSLAISGRNLACQPAGSLLLKTTHGTKGFTLTNSGNETIRLTSAGTKETSLQPGAVVVIP